MSTRTYAAIPLRFDRGVLADVARSLPASSLVEQVFQMLAGPMHAARLAAGTKLPSVRTLAHDCEVSADTVARAYEKLVAHGLVEARRGSGYFVRGTGRHKFAGATGRAALSGVLASGRTRWRTLLVKPDDSLKSRTGSGSLPANWYQDDILTGALRAVLRQGVSSLAHYSDLRGYLPLRQQIQLKLQELGIFIEQNDVLVTAGAAEAIHLVCQTLLAGTYVPVLVESPTPPLLTDRMISTGMAVHRVTRHADGPDLDELRALCEQHRPRAFFCSAVLHNPTASNIAPHKAFQILRLAEEFDMFIVEDDSYADLMPRATATPVSRLATLDQLKRVIYVGSFSATLGPGLRMGFLAAARERMEWLTTYRVVQGISGSVLGERVLYKALSSGEYRRHCEQLRNRLAQARPVVLQELQRWGLTVEHPPEAGLFVWASLGAGVDSAPVAERMLELGHLLAPGEAFLPENSPPSSHLRINVAETLETAMLPTLGKLLGRTPKSK